MNIIIIINIIIYLEDFSFKKKYIYLEDFKINKGFRDQYESEKTNIKKY